ncbi:MAG: ABC transporter ATP-binding protein [Phycisphaeraceae bacterium]|nr:ABC transporter ATP-binding protein [Phycisphaeraceae bacterium]
MTAPQAPISPAHETTHAVSTPITIRNLTKQYGRGNRAIFAVDHIDLDIQPGELFFLLGPSGCGKTTLLRMIAGFIEPTDGTIHFADQDVTHVSARKRDTGMVFQSYALWPHMTVEQNVAFGLKINKVPAAERDTRVYDALKAVQLEQLAGRRPNELSGGQQQRVALARALVVRPSVLLLDEPLSNLDAKLRIELRSEIRRVCKASGITTIYVTHDQKEALSMADRMAVLDRGKIVQIGAPGELYRRPRTKFVADFLGETTFIDARVQHVDDSGVVVSTPAGLLRSSTDAACSIKTLAPDARVTCSLRPEALSVEPLQTPEPVPGTIGLVGTLQHTTYLGEIAHHDVKLSNGVIAKIAQLNPSPHTMPTEGERVLVTANPDDVVLVGQSSVLTGSNKTHLVMS